MFIKDINSFKKAGPDRWGLLLPLYDKTGNFIKQFVPKIFFLEKKTTKEKLRRLNMAVSWKKKKIDQ